MHRAAILTNDLNGTLQVSISIQSTLLLKATNAAVRGAEAVIRLHKAWLEETLSSTPNTDGLPALR